MVKLHLTDDVAQGSGGEVLNRRERTLDTVSIKLGVGDLEEYDGVDLHRHVILGDHRLRLEINDLFLNRNLFGDPVDERDLDVQAGFPGGLIGAQTLDDVDNRLRNNPHVGADDSNNQDHDDQKHKSWQHRFSSLYNYNMIFWHLPSATI